MTELYIKTFTSIKRLNKELDRVIEKWVSWEHEVKKINDYPYDRNTQSEVYRDGIENIARHNQLQAETLQFLDKHISGHGFICGVDGKKIDRRDLRLKFRVAQRLGDLRGLSARLPHAESYTLRKFRKLWKAILDILAILKNYSD